MAVLSGNRFWRVTVGLASVFIDWLFIFIHSKAVLCKEPPHLEN
jgi:thiosulfate reductase cytochrome b subunit